MADNTQDEAWSEQQRVDYEASGNPLYVWSAYCDARSSKRPVPEWVWRYFDDCALEFWHLWTTAAHGGDIGDVSVAVAEAMKLKKPGRSGRKTVFSEFVDTDWLFYGSTVARYVRQGDQETYAVQDVAKRNRVSESKVYRAWTRFKAQYPQEAGVS